MGSLFYFILIVLLSSLVAGVILALMVKKFYWGPTGLPPKQRYHGKNQKTNLKTSLIDAKRKTGK